MPTRQWFVRLLDKKEALIAKGEEIHWHPAHMGKRFRDWTENLAFDWCVSRQRYFGVPIPVWYPLDDRGAPIFDAAIVAEPGQMPVDPMEDTPPGYQESQRNQPGGFGAEPDIFDTWFTSSMTPQISSHWRIDPERHATLFPADVRPQAHDIIRTWAFYTIAKALLHEDSVPWHHAAISGWILDPDRKKMSKSKGNVVTPLPLIDTYGADGVRYWAGNARLGVDTAIDEKVYKIGKRLVTKIFNASKFVLSQTAPVASDHRGAGSRLRRGAAAAGGAGHRILREIRPRPRADGYRELLLEPLHGHLHRAHQDAGPERRRRGRGGARLGGGRPASRPERAAPPHRPLHALHHRRGLVLGLRRGDRSPEHPPGSLAARR